VQAPRQTPPRRIHHLDGADADLCDLFQDRLRITSFGTEAVWHDEADLDAGDQRARLRRGSAEDPFRSTKDRGCGHARERELSEFASRV
jgi:hypothetical protein